MISLLLPMSAFALAASISPGPVNLVCLSSGSRYPLWVGLVFVSGATLGFIALFLAVGLGLNRLLAQWPLLLELLRWGGIVFLLYLAWQLWRDEGRLPADRTQRAPGFVTGALMQWLNPKAWLASLAGIAAYTGGQLTPLLVFAGLYLPICWLSLATWVLAGAFLRRWVQRPAWLVAFNRTLAVLLAASCLYLLLD